MLTKELDITERVQPCFIEPMYAEAVRELPDGGIRTYEAKLDGYRSKMSRCRRFLILFGASNELCVKDAG